MGFELANLTDMQKERLNQLENELGIVLVAWDQNSAKDDEYYEMYEDDRI